MYPNTFVVDKNPIMKTEKRMYLVCIKHTPIQKQGVDLVNPSARGCRGLDERNLAKRQQRGKGVYAKPFFTVFFGQATRLKR
jgi:hypothetical protein